ncbi:MAG: hypothetical protein U0S48_11810 [Solirubrobacteraceae bacterium]
MNRVRNNSARHAAICAIRAGLWVRETSPKGDTAESTGDERFERRPEHAEVDEPGQQTYAGTGERTERRSAAHGARGPTGGPERLTDPAAVSSRTARAAAAA